MESNDDTPRLLVSALVTNSDGAALLTRHSPHWKWHLPDGDVRFGEKLSDAMRRSFRDDFGLSLHLIGMRPWLVTETVNQSRRLHVVAHHFRAEVVGGADGIVGRDDLRIMWFAPRLLTANLKYFMLQSTAQALREACGHA